MQTHQFHLVLGPSEGATLHRQDFTTVDGARLELWLDGVGTVYELSLSRTRIATEPSPAPVRPVPPVTPEPVFSDLLQMPRLYDPAAGGRVILEWRGQLLATPIELETLPQGRWVTVVARWSEGGAPVLQLEHSAGRHCADFYVRRITAWGERRFALLELPDGLTPSTEERIWVLIEVLGPDTLRTLAAGELLRCLGEMESAAANATPLEQAITLFGLMPDQFSPEFQTQRHSRLEADPRQHGPTYCLACESPVPPDDAFCPACGVRRQAPPCPECREPLTNRKDGRRFYHTENGTYPWHLGWDGHCVHCGHHLAAQVRLNTGHRALVRSPRRLEEITLARTEGYIDPLAGESVVEVEPGESIRVEADQWDYQPTVEVRVRRGLAASQGEVPGALHTVERIVLTPEECYALLDQLQGPLAVLLERRKWSRDTT
jgi:hypothetical protein